MSEPTELRTGCLFLRHFRLVNAEDVCAHAKDLEWALYLGPERLCRTFVVMPRSMWQDAS